VQGVIVGLGVFAKTKVSFVYLKYIPFYIKEKETEICKNTFKHVNIRAWSRYQYMKKKKL